MAANSPICLPLRGEVYVPTSWSWVGLRPFKPQSRAEALPCDFQGYHHKRPGSFHLVTWKACFPYAPSLSLLEPATTLWTAQATWRGHVEGCKYSSQQSQPSQASQSSLPRHQTCEWRGLQIILVPNHLSRPSCFSLPYWVPRNHETRHPHCALSGFLKPQNGCYFTTWSYGRFAVQQ